MNFQVQLSKLFFVAIASVASFGFSGFVTADSGDIQLDLNAKTILSQEAESDSLFNAKTARHGSSSGKSKGDRGASGATGATGAIGATGPDVEPSSAYGEFIVQGASIDHPLNVVCSTTGPTIESIILPIAFTQAGSDDGFIEASDLGGEYILQPGIYKVTYRVDGLDELDNGENWINLSLSNASGVNMPVVDSFYQLISQTDYEDAWSTSIIEVTHSNQFLAVYYVAKGNTAPNTSMISINNSPAVTKLLIQKLN